MARSRYGRRTIPLGGLTHTNEQYARAIVDEVLRDARIDELSLINQIIDSLAEVGLIVSDNDDEYLTD